MGRYQKAHADVDKGGKAMRKTDRRAHKAGQGAMDVIAGDLMSTHRGQTKKLNRANARTLDRIMRLNTQQTMANSKSIAGMDKYAKALGGGPNGALTGGRAGGILQFYMDKPEALARANAKLGKAEGRYGRDLGQNAKELMAIAGADAKAQSASADFLMSKTSFQRAGVTAELIATQHHDINVQKLQAQAQMDVTRLQGKIARRNAEHAAKLAAGELGPPGTQMLSAASETMGWLDKITRLTQGDDGATVDEAVQQIIMEASTAGTPMSPGDLAALTKLSNGLVQARESDSNMGHTEREDLVLGILKTVPEWAEMSNHKSIRQFVKSSYAADAAEKPDGEDPVTGLSTNWKTNYKATMKAAERRGEEVDETSVKTLASAEPLAALIMNEYPDLTKAEAMELAKHSLGIVTGGPLAHLMSGIDPPNYPVGYGDMVKAAMNKNKLPDITIRTTQTNLPSLTLG